MKVKKIPLRTCIITKEQLPKQELLRVVRTPYGEVVTVLERAIKGKVLEKKLECPIEDSVYEQIRKIIEK